MLIKNISVNSPTTRVWGPVEVRLDMERTPMLERHENEQDPRNPDQAGLFTRYCVRADTSSAAAKPCNGSPAALPAPAPRLPKVAAPPAAKAAALLHNPPRRPSTPKSKKSHKAAAAQ